MLFRYLAGALMGIAIGASVGRDWPSAAGWLTYLGMLSALVFLVLAQSRFKKLASKHG
jgi:general stress protein CsbA